MLFLIEYDRIRGQIVTLRTFDNSERLKAQDSRLALELSLHRRGIEREVVLLDAASEAAVRLTHARYFYDLSELIAKFRDALAA
jgi:hypothetical protein